jgi:hypothetical protein
MKRRTIAAAFTTLALGSAVAVLDVAPTLAQITDPVPSNPNILTAIQSLRADLTTAFNQVLQSLQNIQAALETLTPAPVGNVLNTTILDFSPSNTQSAVFLCNVTNVAAVDRTVVIEFVEPSGTVHSSFSPAVLTPGKSTFGGVQASFQTNTSLRCRFTVQNGTKQDIIGEQVLNIFTGPSALVTTTAVEAR